MRRNGRVARTEQCRDRVGRVPVLVQVGVLPNAEVNHYSSKNAKCQFHPRQARQAMGRGRASGVRNRNREVDVILRRCTLQARTAQAQPDVRRHAPSANAFSTDLPHFTAGPSPTCR